MCRKDIQNILDDLLNKKPEQETVQEPPKKRMTNLQKIKLIEEVLDREIRPQLKKDGGDLELIDVEGNTVTIAFRGMCAGCRSAAFTRQDFIQGKLREFVDPELVVVE